MITFFTTAKGFSGINGVHQRNAIRSWRRLHPEVEILLFGNGEGYADAVRALGVRHVPDVETNEKGMPRIDSMFALAQEQGRHPLQAYANCDILLLDDFLAAVQRIRFPRFMLVAQRWNLDVDREIDLEAPGWQDSLRADVRARGGLFTPQGIDLFLQQGRIWRDLPPMVVGRGGYDNWLIYHCMSRRIPVVDATDVVTLIHQNHDYGHVTGGQTEVMDGAEAERNRAMGGGRDYSFTIEDADWRLTAKGLVRNRCRGDSGRAVHVFTALHPESPLSRSRAGRALLEAWFEWIERLRQARGGAWKPLAKFIPWLMLRLSGGR